MYAILKTGGKQYAGIWGDVIYVEKLGVEDSATVPRRVLAVGEGRFHHRRRSVRFRRSRDRHGPKKDRQGNERSTSSR